MIKTLTIPITDWHIPVKLGSIGYEGDTGYCRLEFTGADPDLQYKLDFQATIEAQYPVETAEEPIEAV